jgi:hypothetical protein
VIQQRLKSAIAAKEAIKDVENELEKLMTERKRIEEDKVSHFSKNSFKLSFRKMVRVKF